MSNEKKYTEQDLVLAQREGFRAGSRWLACWCDCNCSVGDYPWFKGDNDQRVGDEAAKRFPLPKVTRPRVVQDWYGDEGEPVWFRVEAGGGIAYQLIENGSMWHTVGRLVAGDGSWPRDEISATQQMYRWVGIWGDLRNNSTEEVGDA